MPPRSRKVRERQHRRGTDQWTHDGFQPRYLPFRWSLATRCTLLTKAVRCIPACCLDRLPKREPSSWFPQSRAELSPRTFRRPGVLKSRNYKPQYSPIIIDDQNVSCASRLIKPTGNSLATSCRSWAENIQRCREHDARRTFDLYIDSPKQLWALVSCVGTHFT